MSMCAYSSRPPISSKQNASAFWPKTRTHSYECLVHFGPKKRYKLNPTRKAHARGPPCDWPASLHCIHLFLYCKVEGTPGFVYTANSGFQLRFLASFGGHSLRGAFHTVPPYKWAPGTSQRASQRVYTPFTYVTTFALMRVGDERPTLNHDPATSTYTHEPGHPVAVPLPQHLGSELPFLRNRSRKACCKRSTTRVFSGCATFSSACACVFFAGGERTKKMRYIAVERGA